MSSRGEKKRKTSTRRAGKGKASRVAVDETWALQIIEAAEDMICLCRDGCIDYINDAGQRMLGSAAGNSVVGRQFAEFTHAEYRHVAEGLPALLAEEGAALPLKLIPAEGAEIDAEVLATRLGEPEDGVVMVRVRDITERKRTEEALRAAHDELEVRVDERTRDLTLEVIERRRAEEKLRLAATVIETTREGVLITDRDFRVTSANPAFSEITGYESRDVVGEPPPFLAAIREDDALYRAMRRAIDEHGYWQGELWNKRKDGTKFAQRLSVSSITDEEGAVAQYAVLMADITERKQDEERIRHQANFDALTGLPNRALFLDRLNQALPIMRRQQQRLGLMFIDLDGFKLVNDTLGHDVGDLLLQEASTRLEACVRGGDTVARLGGDEFTIIMPNLNDPQNAPTVAQRSLDELARPFYLNDNEVFVSGSIGITVFPDDAKEAGDLLKNADAAMYRAKDQGKANYQFFTADLNTEASERLVLKNGLIKARERDEFSLHYQPKMEIESGRITGVEALLRWNSQHLGAVSPVRFIPIMEETGQLVEVGEWVLRTAARQHRTWLEDGLPPTAVAVNLSARQLREPNLVGVVEAALWDAGIGPEALEIEITESMLMADYGNSIVALGQIQEMGIRVAMDDFGTGYSSLSYLKRFAIDTIKIDRSFVADIADDPDDVEIIKAIINMGQSLNRRVIAEGVETEEQLAILRENRCDEMQGYLLSPPLPAPQMTKFLKEKRGLGA